ncbi:hypothetical protein [Micromonospora costi]|uniref:Uncharacterized protein n=1 Tax=Micromonospora costi TaxID=1530042 RepID=A0A3B0A6B1_9ACTN|nr:hypothetical protein [Micromonospora costi]RKN55941.1 hypothetical protein D7193_15255 [Micromonospora costi]
MATYQLVGECAYVSTNTALGRAKVLVHKGALIPADAPELKHLLDIGMAARVGGDETGGVNAAGEPAAVADRTVVPASDGSRAMEPVEEQTATGTAHGQSLNVSNADAEPTEEDKAAAETAARRQAAREKLAALGGKAPDGRASTDVLVEYLVAQGGNYDDLIRSERSDLVETVKSRQG